MLTHRLKDENNLIAKCQLLVAIFNTIPMFPVKGFLTCDIQGDGGRDRGVFAQVAAERGPVVVVDDGRDAHAAATLPVSFPQTDDGAVPQPDQIVVNRSVVAAVRPTHQRHGLLQLRLYDAVGVDCRDGLDLDTLGNETGERERLMDG